MNKKYKIIYNYDTGNSFNHEPDNEETLDIKFDNLEVAKANLKRIDEHYKQYKELRDYSSWSKTPKRTKDEILEANKDKDWFVNIAQFIVKYSNGKMYIDESEKGKYVKRGEEVYLGINETHAENCIILYTDEGKPYQFRCPWCGYFETFNFAKIEYNNKEIDDMTVYG